MFLAQKIFDFIFPQTCFICGDSGCEICLNCIKRLRRARPKCLKCAQENPFGVYCATHRESTQPDRVIAPFAFNGPLRELIHQLKYEDVTNVVEPLSLEVAHLTKTIPNYREFIITYIPLAKKRLLERGYNQSELIAEAVSDVLKVTLTGMLTRVEGHLTQVQSGDQKRRRQNVKGVFKIKQDVEIPENVILIDDVITTGATVEEAAKVLKKAGAKTVIVLALALA